MNGLLKHWQVHLMWCYTIAVWQVKIHLHMWYKSFYIVHLSISGLECKGWSERNMAWLLGYWNTCFELSDTSKLIFTVFTSTHFDSWEHQALRTILRQQIPLTAFPLQTKVKVCVCKCNLLLQLKWDSEEFSIGPIFFFFWQKTLKQTHTHRPSSPSWEKSSLISLPSLYFFSLCHWKVNHSFQFHCCHFMLSSLDSSACALTSLVEKWVQKALRLVSKGRYYSLTHFSCLFLSLSYIIHSHSPSYIPQLTNLTETTKCISPTVSSQITFISIERIKTTIIDCRGNHIWFNVCVFCTILNFSYFCISVFVLLLLQLTQLY